MDQERNCVEIFEAFQLFWPGWYLTSIMVLFLDSTFLVSVFFSVTIPIIMEKLEKYPFMQVSYVVDGFFQKFSVAFC